MTKKTIDFSGVQRRNFDPINYPEGDYKAKITKQELTQSKSDNTDMFVFTIQVKSGTYPYYCKLSPTQLWKLRELLEATGMRVPSKAVQIDTAKLVGKTLIATLADDEYNGRLKSVVVSVKAETEAEEPEESEDDFDDFDEPEPKPKKTKKKKSKKNIDPDFTDFDEVD